MWLCSLKAKSWRKTIPFIHRMNIKEEGWGAACAERRERWFSTFSSKHSLVETLPQDEKVWSKPSGCRRAEGVLRDSYRFTPRHRRKVSNILLSFWASTESEALTASHADGRQRSQNVECKTNTAGDHGSTAVKRSQRLALLEGGSSDFCPPRVRTAGGLASRLRPPLAAAWTLVPLQRGNKEQVSVHDSAWAYLWNILQ